MNYISRLLLSTFLLSSLQAIAHPEVPGEAVIAKATELGVHRIERLVTLNRIDPTFVSNLQVMKAERVNQGGAIYKITALVEPDANGQTSTLEMMSDKTGKVLSHTAGTVYPPANPIVWPIKDAATLFEDALHFVLEGWVQYPEVKNFYLGLMTITLQAINENGQMIAYFTVTSDDDSRTLHIKLKTDGTVISHEIK